MNSKPVHRRLLPTKQTSSSFEPDRIDLTHAHLDPYPRPKVDASGRLQDVLSQGNSLFHSRAAASVRADVGKNVYIEPLPTTEPTGDFDSNALQESKKYSYNIDSPITILIPTPKCLAAMAYLDYFQNDDDVNKPPGETLLSLVSKAISGSSPGWCGVWPPGVTGALSQAFHPSTLPSSHAVTLVTPF